MKRRRTRVEGEKTKRLSVDIDEELYKATKIKIINEDITLRFYIEKLIREDLQKEKE